MNGVIKWFHANKLSVNIDKTIIWFTNLINVWNNLDNFTVIMDGKELDKIKSCKLLGVWFDTDLNWKQHITYIFNKISKPLSGFSKTKVRYSLEKYHDSIVLLLGVPLSSLLLYYLGYRSLIRIHWTSLLNYRRKW